MTVSERAARIHRDAIIIDGHSDILLPIVDGRTTLTRAFPEAELERWRTVARNMPPPPSAGDLPWDWDPLGLLIGPSGQYELPVLEAGGITAQCIAIYMHEEHLNHPLETALQMVAQMHREIDSEPERCLLATSVADLRRAKSEGKVAYILAFEGAEPIGRRLALWEVFARLGLRMATFTHSRRNDLADGTQLHINTGGLTALGRESVRICHALGIVIDLAHISDRGFWDIIELAEGPVLCSHTSVLQVIEGYRAPWDEVNPTYGMTKMEAIAKAGGLIGVVFAGMADTNALVDEVDAIVEQVGPDHVGLGSDFYGLDLPGFPSDLRHMGEYPRLTAKLVERGYDDLKIHKVLGGNYLRIFEQVWR
ncbi:MAG: hypothetical protein DCC58_01590 [Chloroflexi bacterium]|nr:MAG: hypothetical protein DCC58_01590 [Chloroflexota bacterium]